MFFEIIRAMIQNDDIKYRVVNRTIKKNLGKYNPVA